MKRLFRHHGPLLIAFAATLWALDGIIRRNLFSLLPIIIVFYEHLIGSAIFIPHLIKNNIIRKFSKADIGALFVVSFVSSVLGTLWFTTALGQVQFIPFSVVLLLQKLQPVFAVSTAVILLKERVNKNYVQWAILALVSAYFVTFPNGIVSIQENHNNIIAALYAVGAAIAWGSGTAFSRYLLKKYPATSITGLRFILATVFSFILIVVTGKSSHLSAPSAQQIGQLFLIAFSTGMVAMWIYYQGLKKTPASVSTIVELVFPALAVFIDIVLYKTVLLPTQYIAAVVLLFAIYKTARTSA